MDYNEIVKDPEFQALSKKDKEGVITNYFTQFVDSDPEFQAMAAKDPAVRTEIWNKLYKTMMTKPGSNPNAPTFTVGTDVMGVSPSNDGTGTADIQTKDVVPESVGRAGLEIVGQVGGTAVGAPLGPAGVIAGSAGGTALGGAAGDYLYGPREGGALKNVAKDAAFGGAFGAVGPAMRAVAPAIKATKAGKYAVDLLGRPAEAITSISQNVPEHLKNAVEAGIKLTGVAAAEVPLYYGLDALGVDKQSKAVIMSLAGMGMLSWTSAGKDVKGIFEAAAAKRSATREAFLTKRLGTSKAEFEATIKTLDPEIQATYAAKKNVPITREEIQKAKKVIEWSLKDYDKKMAAAPKALKKYKKVIYDKVLSDTGSVGEANRLSSDAALAMEKEQLEGSRDLLEGLLKNKTYREGLTYGALAEAFHSRRIRVQASWSAEKYGPATATGVKSLLFDKADKNQQQPTEELPQQLDLG